MAMSVIRCPFCDRRYNVTGIPPGTKVLCTSCRATLTVPFRRPTVPPLWRRWLPDSASAQVALGMVGGLVLATSAWLGLRPGSAALPVGEVPREAPAVVERQIPRRTEAPPFFMSTSREDQIRRFTGAIYREFGPDRFKFDHRSSSPFILAGELTPGVTTPQLSLMFGQFQEALESLEQRFRQEFAEPIGLGLIDEVLPVVIFTSRESFGDYMRKGNNPPPSDVWGLYESAKLRAVFLHDGNSEGYRIDVVLHEAAHQLVHYYVRREAGQEHGQSWWFQEGMGTYFEQFVRSQTGRVVVDPALVSLRLPTLRDAIKRGELPDLNVLMGMSLDDIWVNCRAPSATLEEQERKRRFTQQCYAESWALVQYLRHGAGGKYRKFFDDYFLLELRGQGGKDAFIRLLDRFGMEHEDLKRELQEYIKGLPSP
jgi:hypothetical protein